MTYLLSLKLNKSIFAFYLIADFRKTTKESFIKYDNIQISFRHDGQFIYQMDISFENVARFYGNQLDDDTIQLMIFLRKPCKVFMKDLGNKLSKFQEVESPFMIRSNEKQFMNYWNLRQVIFLEGKGDLVMNLDTLKEKLQVMDIIPKISVNGLGNIKLIEPEEYNPIHEQLFERSLKFFDQLNKLIIPIRFGILALVSQQKVSIFTNEILEFIQYILTAKYHQKTIFEKEQDPEIVDYFIDSKNL